MKSGKQAAAKIDNSEKDSASMKPGSGQEEDAAAKNGLYVDFTIEVSKEEIEKKFGENVQKYAAKMKVPGFRKGKVPIDVVKSRFREAITNEVFEELIKKYVYERIEKEKLKIASPPRIEKIDYEEGKDLAAEVKVEILPEVVLPELEKVEVKIPTKELKLAEYDEEKQIDAVLESRKKKVAVDDREVKEGDLVLFTYQSRILETKRMTPKKDGQFLVDREAESEILDLYGDVIGKKRKDRITTRRKYPGDYKKKAWAGKEIEHYIEITNIYALVKPQFDQEFLKSLGFEDEQVFKKKLKEEYEQREKQRREDVVMKHIIDTLKEVVEFPVPRSLVEEEVARMLGNAASRLKFKDKQQAREYLAPFMTQAEANVKLSFILDAVRKKYKLEVTHEDLDREYRKIADANNLPLPEVQKYYKNPEHSKPLKDSLLQAKVMECLKEKVEIKEVKK